MRFAVTPGINQFASGILFSQGVSLIFFAQNSQGVNLNFSKNSQGVSLVFFPQNSQGVNLDFSQNLQGVSLVVFPLNLQGVSLVVFP